MRKLRKIIIILIILIIITILGLLCVKEQKNPSIGNIVSDSKMEEVYEDIVSLEPVTSRTNYYILQDIIRKYYNAINKKDYDVLYNYLSNGYTQEYNIKKEELGNAFANTEIEYQIEDMYVLNSSNSIFMYLVKTSLIQNESISENFIMVALDMANSIFEIYPDEYVRKYGYDKLNTTKDIKIESIELKQNNTFSFEFITNEEMAENYLEDFKKYIKNNDYKKIYEMLDEEYKKAKFDNYEQFEKYMKANYDRMSKAFLDMYKVTNYDGYTQYICIDNKENYYIFKETAVMTYTVILDNYTINLPDFIQDYESLKETEKATLNIKKFLKAIEDTDYKYAYSKLSKVFRNKYFETQQEFEQYAKQNIIKTNTIKELKVKEQDGLYVCTLEPKNSSIDYSNIKFIVQIDDDIDYQIAFSV